MKVVNCNLGCERRLPQWYHDKFVFLLNLISEVGFWAEGDGDLPADYNEYTVYRCGEEIRFVAMKILETYEIFDK